MRESDTYQAILDEGRVEGNRRTLLRLGLRKIGEPDQATRIAPFAITDPDRLELLIERLLDVSTWSDLLQTP